MFGERLRELRKKRRLTMKEFGKRFGLAESTISGYETDTRKPDFETLQKFADFFSVTVDELLGRSVVYSLPPNLIPTGPKRDIPIVAEIACGSPAFTSDDILGYQAIDTSVVNLNGGEYVWLKAKGDSMINAGIFPGALVLIRLQPEAENGEIAAVCVDQENATLKRIHDNGETVTLIPDNPMYRPETYEKARIRVVGVARKVLSDLR